MSRFRRERVYASVECDRVALVRLDAANAAQEHAVVALPLDPEHPEEAIRDLGATLDSPAWRAAPRRLVVSDRLVRYLVLERPEGVRSLAELRLACEARFQVGFDRPASEWTISIDARPFARRFLACGMHRRLFTALSEVFGASGPVVSLRPYLVAELARRARHLPAPCWFIAAARDCITLAGLTDEGCRVIRTLVREEPPSASSIEDALAREKLLAGEMALEAPGLVAGAITGDLTAASVRRVDAPTWGTHNAGWSQHYRLALSEHWA